MSFLEISRLVVPVADGTLRTVLVEPGQSRARSPRGTYADGPRTADVRKDLRREWTFETPPLVEDDAETLALWVAGRKMWRVDFNLGRLASDNGLCPLRGFGGNLSTATKMASKFQSLALASSVLQYRIPYNGGDPSAAGWFFNGATWDHRARVGNTYYLNGAVTGAFGHLTFALTVTDALWSISTASHVQEVVLASWAWTAKQVTALFQHAGTESLAPFPEHKLVGDLLRESPFVVPRVRCVDVSDAYLQGGRSGWQNNLRAVTVTLREV